MAVVLIGQTESAADNDESNSIPAGKVIVLALAVIVVCVLVIVCWMNWFFLLHSLRTTKVTRESKVWR